MIAWLLVIWLGVVFLGAQETDEPKKPISLDRSILSGVGLAKIDLKDEPEKDFYQKRLYWGKELGVFVVGTETWTNTITDYPFDEFIYMYNGEAIVKPREGASQIFYAGDYFFAPKGYKGAWEVKGNNQIHYELSEDNTTLKVNRIFEPIRRIINTEEYVEFRKFMLDIHESENVHLLFK